MLPARPHAIPQPPRGHVSLYTALQALQAETTSYSEKRLLTAIKMGNEEL